MTTSEKIQKNLNLNPFFFSRRAAAPPSPLVLQIFPLQPPAQASNFAAGSTIIFFSQTDTISLPSPLLPLSLKPNQSSHSAPTPFSFQNRSRNRSLLSHDCYPISFSSTTFSWGAPDFLFLLTQKKPSPETSPLTSKGTLPLGQREKPTFHLLKEEPTPILAPVIFPLVALSQTDRPPLHTDLPLSSVPPPAVAASSSPSFSSTATAADQPRPVISSTRHQRPSSSSSLTDPICHPKQRRRRRSPNPQIGLQQQTPPALQRRLFPITATPPPHPRRWVLHGGSATERRRR